MFRSLRLVNYRYLFVGALVSNTGHWMQSTAMSWVVLTVLTDDDATAMGIALALQFAPPLLLVGVSGWVADRFERWRVLLVTQSSLAVVATVIGILMLSGTMELWAMYLFCVTLGCFAAFDGPARQAFVSDVVPRESASNAIALNSASFNGARLFGPAVAGVAIITIGSGWVFIANAVSYVAMLVAILAMHRDQFQHRERKAGGRGFTAGFRYLRRRPDLIVTLVMIFLMGTFGMNFPIYASTMTLEFGLDADAFGLLTSVLAIGAIGGSLAAAKRDAATLNWIVIAAFVFVAATVAGSFAPNYWVFMVTCIFLGFGTVTMLTTANGYVQTTTDPSLRGRVLAIYMALLMGGTFLGAPISGWVVSTYGPRAALLLGSAAGLVAALVGLTRLIVARGRPPVDTATIRVIEPTEAPTP